MSKFENEAIIKPEFSNMVVLAKTYFKNNPKKSEYHQCLVLKTDSGEEKVYSFACTSVKNLIDQSCSVLLQERNSTIRKIVCMWEGGAIDVPSLQFMKMLCNINAENKEAEVLLSASTNTYVTKKIADIIG